MRFVRAVPLAIIVSACLSLGGPARANAPNGGGVKSIPESSIQKVVDGIIQPFLSKNKLPGAIVGVSIDGQRYFFPYGKATDAGDAFTPDTIVEIGSCTKVFTTTIFARAINDKLISRDAYAKKYMPNGLKLEPAAQKLTLLQLADFRSGMPRDPPVSGNRSITDYTTKDFLKWVSEWNPATRPPAPYMYSNAGIGLLSYLVADATGKSWEGQLDSELLDPLSMQDTSLRPGPAETKHIATGHDAKGKDAPPWPVFAWYAAGGLRSTARDMLRFGEANLGHKEVDGRRVPDALIAAMLLAQKPIYTLPNGDNEQGMAWVTAPGNAQEGTHAVTFKNGGTDGFGSVILINPSKDLALFIAVNQQTSNPTNVGIELARHLQTMK